MEPNGPHVIFYDPLASETQQHASHNLPKGPDAPLKQPPHLKRLNRKEAAHIEALEAVSRDLAILAVLRGRSRQ